MVAANRSITMFDLSRQKRLDARLDRGELSGRHTVGQAVEHYLDRMGAQAGSRRWTAFSRGVKLDNKCLIDDVSATDTEWTVMPEVSAG